MAQTSTEAAGTGTGKLLSEAAHDLAARLRRDVAETVGGGYYSSSSGSWSSVDDCLHMIESDIQNECWETSGNPT